MKKAKAKALESLKGEERVCEDTQAICYDIFATKDAIDIALHEQSKLFHIWLLAKGLEGNAKEFKKEFI